jgi:hypothetical protein
MIPARFHRQGRKLLIAGTAVLLAGAGAGIAVGVAGSGGRYVPQLHATVPAAKAVQVEHAQPGTAAESTVPAPAPTAPIAPIPAALIPAGSAPVPLSPALVRVRNAWVVSDGETLVAVYAGAAGDQARDGRLVILRQNLAAGTQSQRVVSLSGTGALTIDRAPIGASVERSAQSGTLGFRSASGRAGILDLRLGRAALAP